MTAYDFACIEFRHYTIYKALAQKETNQEFKKILNELVEHEKADYEFWQSLSSKKDLHVNNLEVFLFIRARAIFGLTFIGKLLESGESKTLRHYEKFIKTAAPELRGKITELIARETEHETKLIQQIKEEKVEFISSIVLGINDGIIELSGALVGFSFAFSQPLVVALSGLITGIAASLSMSASAYMQALHETNGRNPIKSATYTGISYGIVVALLVTPFFLVSTSFIALGVMLVTVVAIIAAVSFYTSVIFSRQFRKQFGRMLFFSVGVAFIAFVIGLMFRKLSGIEI